MLKHVRRYAVRDLATQRTEFCRAIFCERAAVANPPPMKLIVSCLIAAGLASTFCAGSARATEITDHFDDGVIDPSIWAVGGSKRGTDGYNGGTWNWSVTEIPGSINLRVWGPPMANTYGSEAWMKTQHNFNDGSNYTINFTWGFTANAYHIDYVAFQITDGSIVIDNNYAWYRDGAPGTHNIFSVYSSGPSPDYGMVNTPPTAWSILLDSTNRQATV